MKHTLIDLQTKVIDLPDHRPFYRQLVHKGSLVPLEVNYENIDPVAIPSEYEKVDYRVVRIYGGKNGENGNYLVNDGMWHKAIPLIDNIIKEGTRELTSENIELKIKVAYLTDVKNSYEKTWWIRLKQFLISLTKPK